MNQPLDLAAIQARFEATTHPGWRESTDVGRLLAEVQRLTAERALYVGVEPTIAEEMAELSRRLDAVDAVVERWNEHCIGPQTRFLLADITAAVDGEPAPSGPQTPATPALES